MKNRIKTLSCAFIIFFLAFNLSAQNRNVTDFSLRSLQTYQYRTSPITIQRLAFKNELQYAYNVLFTSMDLTVSARLSIPAIPTADIKGIVIMLRGYQRPVGYYTGRGTENPARVYLENGWAVIAPDFFGYGSSSPIPSPHFLHQFYSTINAVELYKSLEQPVFIFNAAISAADRITLPAAFEKIVLWGHSNGGQVALHFLQIIQKPIATVLWAPVSADFPDSAGRFGYGEAWAERFRRDYPASDFSLIARLDKIADGTPILLEQGDRDTVVPKAWSDAFSQAVEAENLRRQRTNRGLINLRYIVYEGADHNLNPFWNTVLPGNVMFWQTH